jgi:hypothetical protein
MSTWTSDELEKIGRAEELEIASVRRDGTLRRQAGGVAKDVLLVESVENG